MTKIAYFSTLAVAVLISASLSYAEDTCEVMTLNGSATVVTGSASRPMAQADILKAGDRIEVPAGSYADIAFDAQWNNIARLTGPTKVTLKSIYPTGLDMQNGDIFAQLKKLPNHSTFEIQTPTGVAAVRGSAYRTTHDEEGTHVYNFSPSPVEVFGVDGEGNLSGDPVILKETEKTELDTAGEPPAKPEPMTEEEKKAGSEMQSGVQKEVSDAVTEGREGHIADIQTIEKEYDAGLEQRLSESSTDKGTAPLEDVKEATRDTDAGPLTPDFDRVLTETEKSVTKLEDSQERHDQKLPEDDGTNDGTKTDDQKHTIGGGTYQGGGG